ncbi:hypothetical protein OQ601_06205 [Acinetobacter baumannii]|uniref:hypothetical protein n=1 Tax=Acinetobacter baumannii TaxID=470 RepID=UPI0022473031|nr:hypothetical protein [Acinetobacter baumannii]MCX2426751.1 hypothetical protein [Acinetobacter baumannii]
MNAIKFIKDHGVDKAREELKKLPNSDVTHMTDDARMFVDENNPLLDEFQRNQIKDLICIDDLKRLVESVDLIKKHGGLFSTKCQLDKGGSHYEWYGENGDYGLTDLEDLEQAIADYE